MSKLSIHDFPLSKEQLIEWDGWCFELVNELLFSHPKGKILYIEPDGFNDLICNGKHWKYHAVLLLKGKTYDAWNPTINTTPKKYVKIVFGSAKWEIIDNE